VFRADDRALRHCGREIGPGRTWCPEHVQRAALITSAPQPVSTLMPPLGPVSNEFGADDPPGHVRSAT